MDLKSALNAVKDGLNSELKKADKLSGDKLKSFINMFGVEEDADIFFTKYNLIITDIETNEKIQTYLKPETLILKIEIKSFHAYLWVYDFSNDALFDQLLNDFELEE